jgi:hypothetical protein
LQKYATFVEVIDLWNVDYWDDERAEIFVALV